MANDDDPLDKEISIAAKLEDNGIVAKAKSRTLAAIDRLCGSLIDIPGSHIERISLKTRAETKAQTDLISVDAEAAKRLLIESGQAGNRALGVFLDEQRRKQDNRDAVAQAAVEELKALPPPNSNDGADEISDDWMNVFSSHAQNASSEHLRTLWGRILAGEIRKPGSFSLTSIRMISELDKDIAETFQSHVQLRMNDMYILKPKEIKGKLLLELAFLEEVGLLHGAHAGLSRNFDAQADGYVYIRNGKRMLRVKPKESKKISINVIKITRVGVEIAAILPPQKDEDVLMAIVPTIQANAETIDLCAITKEVESGFEWIAIANLATSDPPTTSDA